MVMNCFLDKALARARKGHAIETDYSKYSVCRIKIITN